MFMLMASAILVLASRRMGILLSLFSVALIKAPLTFDWLPGITFGWDVLANFQQLFGVFALLVVIAILYSRKMEAKYLSSMMVFCAGLLGFLGASHPLQFFMFLELMIFPAFYLLLERDPTTAFKYFAFMQVSSILVLAGMISSGAIASLLLTLGFSIKMGLFPLGSWLPDAHSQAPHPLSALFSGALVACGVYGLYRFSYNFLLLLVLAIISIVYGAVRASKEEDLKRLLAYSTVSQMGYAALALLFAPEILPLFLLMHSLAKAGLFFAAGSIIEQTGISNISQLSVSSSSLTLPIIISALSMAGIPPLLGFWIELTIFKGIAAYSLLLLMGVLIAAAFTIFYVERLVSIFMRRSPKRVEDWLSVIPAILLVLGVLLVE
ncbi:MAG: hypothetical protein GOV00_03370 [Candidatus Altiarchaeota archaeon]|nr:hypothetical protein [Candidatus Altiarchaeota archaeon]